MADMNNGTVTITGLGEFEKKLEQLKSDSPGFEKRLRDAIRKILGKARSHLQNEAASGLRMQSDPRHAYKAVRYAVYKRIFGGQVNILQPRSAGKGHLYEPPRTLKPHKRGGNRVLRSRRTTDVMSYEGKDRAFVLRFLNQGTGDRAIHSMGGQSLRRGGVGILKTKSIGAHRGAISPRNWFKGASMREMQSTSAEIQNLIDKIIKEEFI
jgi:hypothetical protein